MAEVLKTPLFITWEVTNRCNLRCRTCYNASTEELSAEIVESEVPAVIDSIAECRPLFVQIGGGEPFLRKGIERIVSMLAEKGIESQFVSNGNVRDEGLFVRLKELGVMSIQISVDGFENEHDAIRGKGTFARAIDTIKLLKQLGFALSIGTVITKLNHKNIHALVKYFFNLGVQKYGFFRFFPSGRGSENLELMLSEDDLKRLVKTFESLENEYGADFLKWDHALSVFSGTSKDGGICELGLKCLNIRPNGDVIGCPFLPIVLGNVRKSSLVEIWNDSDELKKIREETKVEALLGKCVECPSNIKSACRGGCKALAYDATGNLKMPDPRCWR